MSRSGRKHAEDQGSFWISYSDLSTALLLVFILLFLAQMAMSQNRMESVRKEIEDLLGAHEALAQKLEVAVTRANEELGEEVFEHHRGIVTVLLPEDKDVAWFESGRAELRPRGREQVAVFYRELYRALLQDDGAPRVPQYLASINIEGHTDPEPKRPRYEDWSWESYNGEGRHTLSTSNLTLSQLRAKAILDHIQQLYTSGSALVDEATMPWRPFAALVQATGRSWTRAYHYFAEEDTIRTLSAQDFLLGVPASLPRDVRVDTFRRSRRVTFSFRLDDGELLRRLKIKFDELRAETRS